VNPSERVDLIPKTSPSITKSQAGFSLIEVVITVAILMTLTIAVAVMMRNGFDVRQGLSDRARVLHRLTVGMEKIGNDLQHTIYVSTRDGDRNGIDRTVKTLFKVEKSGVNGDKLSLTTMTHQPILANSYESDLTMVVYALKDSKTAPGRQDLYRAETPVIPLDIKEEPSMRVLAAGVKSFTVECWNGDRWSKDGWDTSRSETRGLIPRLVKITIEAYVQDRFEGDSQDPTQADQLTEKINSVIYLTRAIEFAEIKERDKNIKWGTL